LRLLLREIETHLGGTLKITRRFQGVGIPLNGMQRIDDILDRPNHRPRLLRLERFVTLPSVSYAT